MTEPITSAAQLEALLANAPPETRQAYERYMRIARRIDVTATWLKHALLDWVFRVAGWKAAARLLRLRIAANVAAYAWHIPRLLVASASAALFALKHEDCSVRVGEWCGQELWVSWSPRTRSFHHGQRAVGGGPVRWDAATSMRRAA